MAKSDVKAILDRVLTWPKARQENAAEILKGMEEQDRSELHLTNEQVAEVRRRLADPNPKTIPLEEAFKRFRSSRA